MGGELGLKEKTWGGKQVSAKWFTEREREGKED